MVGVAGEREDGAQLTLPPAWVGQAGRDRVHVMTGLTTPVEVRPALDVGAREPERVVDRRIRV